jgi:hypothetical protein
MNKENRNEVFQSTLNQRVARVHLGIKVHKSLNSPVLNSGDLLTYYVLSSLGMMRTE